MNIAFDYLRGPVLGHKTRCEILQKELVARGHHIVEPWGTKKDWLVWDYPCTAQGVAVDYKRLLMGQLPVAGNDYAWHPLGAKAERTMHGARYIMVDEINTWQPRTKKNILITCGGSDPYHLTPRLLMQLYGYGNCGVVIGPNFSKAFGTPSNWAVYSAPSRAELRGWMQQYQTVICTWGQTVFEALLMGASVIPITTQAEHEYEAQVLGIPYITSEHDFTEGTLLFRAVRGNYGIDYQGAARVVEQMEAWL